MSAKKNIVKILQNKYVLVPLFMLIWLLFFDRYDLITQLKARYNLYKLKKEKEYYKREIKKDKENLNELLNNKNTLEKYARENYIMKRDNEDIFVIIPSEK